MSDPSRQRGEARPGFAALWRCLLEREARGLIAQNSALARMIASARDAGGAVALTRGSGLDVRHVKALEAGVAYEIAARKLANGVRLGRRYAQEPPATRDEGLASVLLDSLCIYLSAHVDAALRLGKASLGTVAEDDATRRQRESLKAWASAAKKKLSTAREPVAHAETRYVEAIDEDGLWEGLILVGAADYQAIQSLSNDYLSGEHTNFVGRFSVLQKVAVQVLAESDAVLGGIATFLVARPG